MGLDPGSPGSHPQLKPGAKPLSHPGIPGKNIFNDLRIRAPMEMTQKLFGLAGEEDLHGRFS